MVIKHRKQNRLKGFDYSKNGYYFVTICTNKRRCEFGTVKNEIMTLNHYGKIVEKCYEDLINHYSNCVLDEFIIMPNHIHGIIIIQNINQHVGNGLKPFPTKYSISEMIRGLKTFSSRRIHESGLISFKWQKSFYDHIIRTEYSLYSIRQYIRDNPINWNEDRNNLG
ncbi:MAG: transposase [Candidatus Roizmanbacteria bacterium]|nr:transposase [Candidatus Roizmanbacteria bacterium]